MNYNLTEGTQYPIPDTRNSLTNSSFKTLFDTFNWDETLESIFSKTERDVLRALGNSKRDLEDFKALISPAAPLFRTDGTVKSGLNKKTFRQYYANVFANVFE